MNKKLIVALWLCVSVGSGLEASGKSTRKVASIHENVTPAPSTGQRKPPPMLSTIDRAKVSNDMAAQREIDAFDAQRPATADSGRPGAKTAAGETFFGPENRPADYVDSAAIPGVDISQIPGTIDATDGAGSFASRLRVSSEDSQSIGSPRPALEVPVASVLHVPAEYKRLGERTVADDVESFVRMSQSTAGAATGQSGLKELLVGPKKLEAQAALAALKTNNPDLGAQAAFLQKNVQDASARENSLSSKLGTALTKAKQVLTDLITPAPAAPKVQVAEPKRFELSNVLHPKEALNRLSFDVAHAKTQTQIKKTTKQLDTLKQVQAEHVKLTQDLAAKKNDLATLTDKFNAMFKEINGTKPVSEKDIPSWFSAKFAATVEADNTQDNLRTAYLAMQKAQKAVDQATKKETQQANKVKVAQEKATTQMVKAKQQVGGQDSTKLVAVRSEAENRSEKNNATLQDLMTRLSEDSARKPETKKALTDKTKERQSEVTEADAKLQRLTVEYANSLKNAQNPGSGEPTADTRRLEKVYGTGAAPNPITRSTGQRPEPKAPKVIILPKPASVPANTTPPLLPSTRGRKPAHEAASEQTAKALASRNELARDVPGKNDQPQTYEAMLAASKIENRSTEQLQLDLAAEEQASAQMKRAGVDPSLKGKDGPEALHAVVLEQKQENINAMRSELARRGEVIQGDVTGAPAPALATNTPPPLPLRGGKKPAPTARSPLAGQSILGDIAAFNRSRLKTVPVEAAAEGPAKPVAEGSGPASAVPAPATRSPLAGKGFLGDIATFSRTQLKKVPVDTAAEGPAKPAAAPALKPAASTIFTRAAEAARQKAEADAARIPAGEAALKAQRDAFKKLKEDLYWKYDEKMETIRQSSEYQALGEVRQREFERYLQDPKKYTLPAIAAPVAELPVPVIAAAMPLVPAPVVAAPPIRKVETSAAEPGLGEASPTSVAQVDTADASPATTRVPAPAPIDARPKPAPLNPMANSRFAAMAAARERELAESD